MIVTKEHVFELGREHYRVASKKQMTLGFVFLPIGLLSLAGLILGIVFSAPEIAFMLIGLIEFPLGALIVGIVFLGLGSKSKKANDQKVEACGVKLARKEAMKAIEEGSTETYIYDGKDLITGEEIVSEEPLEEQVEEPKESEKEAAPVEEEKKEKAAAPKQQAGSSKEPEAFSANLNSQRGSNKPFRKSNWQNCTLK